MPSFVSDTSPPTAGIPTNIFVTTARNTLETYWVTDQGQMDWGNKHFYDPFSSSTMYQKSIAELVFTPQLLDKIGGLNYLPTFKKQHKPNPFLGHPLEGICNNIGAFT